MNNLQRGAISLAVGIAVASIQHLSSPKAPPAPSFESLAAISGRVRAPAAQCAGGYRDASVFSLTLWSDNQWKTLRLWCNELVRTSALGGTEVTLWVAPAPWPRRPDLQRVWAAAVDQQPILKYSEALAEHERAEQRLPLFVAGVAAIYAAFAFAALHLVSLAKNRPKPTPGNAP